MLDDRKKKVLQAIVEEYINTAEPVSSNALISKYDLNCSSATIRNEMSDLEKKGLLSPPGAAVLSNRAIQLYPIPGTPAGQAAAGARM